MFESEPDNDWVTVAGKHVISVILTGLRVDIEHLVLNQSWVVEDFGLDNWVHEADP